MHGIEKSRVTIHEERSTGFRRDAKTTALVAAQSERNDQLTGQQIETLRQTISASVGTAPENVTVTDLRGPTYPGSSASGAFGSPDYVKAKTLLEKEYKDKFLQAFSYIQGVMVEVNAELNTKVQQKTQMQQYSGPQNVRSILTDNKTTNRSEANGGRPGAVPNGVIANRPEEVAATSSGGTESTTSEHHEENDAQLGQEITEYVEAGLTPKEVVAAIQIPKSYFLTIWQQRNPTTDGSAAAKPDPTKLAQIETDEITRIRDDVAQNLIPRLTLGKDMRPSVSVSSYEPVEQPAPVEPGFAAQAGSFFVANWRTMGLALMAMISLMMVRSIVRGGQRALSAPPQLASTPSPALAMTAARSEARDEQTPAPAVSKPQASAMLKRKFSATGPNLRDELAELVREDPDAAAAIISNWIGDAV
jgi:flagellar biosynthesis/type III secretory pathway M-ring protein FliF/YscJ